MERSFFEKHGFTIVFIVVFSLAFIGMGAKRTLLSNSNNVADWLPEEYQQTQEYKWFIKHFPYESFIVVSWKGCTLDDPRLEMFAQKLVPGQSIDNMDQWSSEDAVLSAELKLHEDFSVNQTDPPNSESLQQERRDLLRLERERMNQPSPGSFGSEPRDSFASGSGSVEITEEDEISRHYFKSVITGPRLVESMRKRYPDMSDAEIFYRLDGVLIGPDYEWKQGMPEDYKHRNTALIVTLGPGAKGKELAKVVEKIKQVGRECGVEPPLPEDNRNYAQKAVDFVSSTLYEMIHGRTPSIDGVILGGPPIDNVAINYEGERTLYRLAGLCAVFGLVIAFVCLRSLFLSLVVFWIGILAAGISLSFVSFSGRHCDAIMLSMPALVYVLTMSGAIHMVNYYFDEVRKGGLLHAPERMVKHAWYPCTVTALTTALGLASLYSSHLTPIIKFGVFSAIGVMFSLTLLFLYLPALLHFCPQKKYAAKHLQNKDGSATDHLFLIFWRFFGGIIIRNHNFVAIGCVLLMIFFAYGFTKINVSVKMMRFFSGDSEIIAHYTWLEEQLGPLVPMEVVIEFDNETCHLLTVERLQYVDNICRELRAALPEEIGGVISAATATPEIKFSGRPNTNYWRMQQYVASDLLDQGRPQMKDYIMIEKYSFDPETAKTPEERLQIKQRLEQMEIDEATAARLCGAGITTLDRLLYDSENRNVPGISREEMDQLRKNAQNWQEKHGKDLWRISMRVWSLKKSDIDYALFIEDVKAVVDPLTHVENNPKIHGENAITAKYTGMVPIVYHTQHELVNGLTQSFCWSFVSIAVVMMFVLKSPIAGFLAMAPNLFPVILIFGFVGHAGILVDVGMMMSASVALGIAVDDTIHYLTWFREAIDRGLSAKEAAMDAYEKCATAMTETTFIAGFGLSAFAFSTFTPTQTFGIMMLVILLTALFGDLIFLPAILTGPAGKFFYRPRKERSGQPEPLDPVLVPGGASEDSSSPVAAFSIFGGEGAEIRPPDPPPDRDAIPSTDRYLGRCHIVDKIGSPSSNSREG